MLRVWNNRHCHSIPEWTTQGSCHASINTGNDLRLRILSANHKAQWGKNSYFYKGNLWTQSDVIVSMLDSGADASCCGRLYQIIGLDRPIGGCATIYYYKSLSTLLLDGRFRY